MGNFGDIFMKMIVSFLKLLKKNLIKNFFQQVLDVDTMSIEKKKKFPIIFDETFNARNFSQKIFFLPLP